MSAPVEPQQPTTPVEFPIVPYHTPVTPGDTHQTTETSAGDFTTDHTSLKTELSKRTLDDFVHIQRLQSAFEKALGISHREAISHNGIIRSYNLVLDRFHFERDVLLNETLSETEKRQAQAQWRANIEWQMITNLSERFNVDSNPYTLRIEGEQLYFSDTKTQPLEEIYWRGVLHRRKESSHESYEGEREEAEFEGFLALQKVFTDPDTPIGTKRVIISPPGRAKKTPYTHNFVDIFELTKDPISEARYIQAMRYATKLSDAQYRRKAHLLDPRYDDNPQSHYAHDDARFLSRPLTPHPEYAVMDADTLYETVFHRDPRSMKYDDFQSVILTEPMMGMIRQYADYLSEPQIDWVKSTRAFNAIPNFGDYQEKQWKRKHQDGRFTRVVFDRFADNQNMRTHSPEALAYYWGNQEVKAVAGGCGNSAGYIMHESLYHGIQDPIARLTANSVAQFGLESKQDEEENYETGTCVECGATNVERGRCSKRCKNVCEPGWFQKNGSISSS